MMMLFEDDPVQVDDDDVSAPGNRYVHLVHLKLKQGSGHEERTGNSREDERSRARSGQARHTSQGLHDG